MSYEEYKAYARAKGFQPLGLEAFEAMRRAGFFEANWKGWEKETKE